MHRVGGSSLIEPYGWYLPRLSCVVGGLCDDKTFATCVSVRIWLDRPERAFSLLRCEGSCWIVDRFCVDRRSIRLFDALNAHSTYFCNSVSRSHVGSLDCPC